jgi:DNA repair protein RadA/Sms
VPTGSTEFDRVLAGGLVPGSVTLLSGPPGVGKSTLALQVAVGLASVEGTAPVLYVAAEETVAQIRLRADRLDLAVPTALLVTDDPQVDELVTLLTERRPAVLLVDSIQAVTDPEVTGVPGSVAQVRSAAQRLATAARATGTGLVLIGHVTKDGAIAGPRTLEHLVDTVVTFEADLDEGLRTLRAIKHRFGPVGELGVFTMARDGLHGVAEVSGLFLQDRPIGAPGSVVCPVRDGRRTLLAEIQALVRPHDGTRGDRRGRGLDTKRLDLVFAVLEAEGRVGGDAFVSVAGGLRVAEPAADLAVAVAVASAATATPVDADVVVCGEVGLTGEVRRVPDVAERLADAAQLGFSRAIVPAGTPTSADGLGLQLERVADLTAGIEAALTGSSPKKAVTRPFASDDPGPFALLH